MDVIDVLGEILADIEKQSADSSAAAAKSAQNGPSKQSINPTNGTTTATALNPPSVRTVSPQQKSVRFTNSPIPPQEENGVEHEHVQLPSRIVNNKSPVPTNNNKLPQPGTPSVPTIMANGSHIQPLQINVDLLQVPGDRSFLHSPSHNILADNNANGGRTPSPGLTSNAPKSPAIVLNKTVAGWIPEERHADASEGIPINEENQDHLFQSYHLDYKYTPPPIKGPCCVCGEGIMGAMVTALDKMWHPEHFTCTECHKELRSPGYAEHAGKPYCKACHNRLFLPPCAGCNKTIEGAYIQPMGIVYHPNCFQCKNCHKVLSPDDFMERDKRAFCEPCYWDLFGIKCKGCKKPIKDDKKVGAAGGTFHPTCFKCCNCNNLLNPNSFKEKNGKLHCIPCYNDMYMPKCTSCKKPITENMTNVPGFGNYHPHCFTCSHPKCKKVLEPNNFLQKNGKQFCSDHYPVKCSGPGGCGQPITDSQKSVTALGKPWHDRCFKCVECRRQLDPSKFFEKDGLPYCEDDYWNKFGTRCAACNTPIKNTKSIFANGKHYHDHCFRCDVCNKILNENEFYEKDGKFYCVKDYLDLFAPKCRKCVKPITDEYCLNALNGDWHADCFRCLDCNCLLENVNFFEIQNNPFCERCFHARQCPDCVRIRIQQNKYFGISETAPMQPKKWASQVSLKSLELNQRPTSQLSQFSYSSSNYEIEYGRNGGFSNGGRITPSLSQNPSARSSYIIPIERDGAHSSLSTSSNHHHHEHNGSCLHDHLHEETIQRSSSALSNTSEQQRSRAAALGGKNVGWKKSQDNLQYIAKNESPYIYLEPGKFPVLEGHNSNGNGNNKHIRFQEVVTKKEYEAVTKHY